MEIDIRDVILKNFVDEIRPEDLEVRKKIDFGYSWDGNIALLFEIRPRWDKTDEILHHEFAKIKYVKSTKEWKLYWLRASGKWEAYEPLSIATNLEKLLDVIKEDDHHCFFG